MNLNDYLRDVPDFPKPGIVFKDISPLLASPVAMQWCVDQMAAGIREAGHVDKIVGVESRGFLFGTPLAMQLKVGFAPIRKPGKLPWETTGVDYALEYGTDRVEIHSDAIKPGDRVVVVDDLLATGGTAAASIKLVEQLGGQVILCSFAVELGFLNGSKVLAPAGVHAVLRIDD